MIIVTRETIDKLCDRILERVSPSHTGPSDQRQPVYRRSILASGRR